MEPLWYVLLLTVLVPSVVEVVKQLANHFGWLKSDWWPRVIAILTGAIAAIPESVMDGTTIGERLLYAGYATLMGVITWYASRDQGLIVGRSEKQLINEVTKDLQALGRGGEPPNGDAP